MSTRPSPSTLTLCLLLILGGACSLACSGQVAGENRPDTKGETPSDSSPRLILLVIIDQARSDYLTRFRPLFHGGLGRLLDNGIFFTQAYHEHARTLTASGHATLVTGLHPAHHGIIGNQWFDREQREDVYCVGDTVHGRSPGHLLGSTLGDWLKKSDPASLVYAASGKDRSAILMGGHEADGAFWYDQATGQFTSSSYYGDSSSSWLTAFNDRKIPDQSFAAPWSPIPLEADLNSFGIVKLDEGAFTTGFPRALGGPSAIPGPGFYTDYYASPAGDRYLAHLAREIVQRKSLGKDDHLDLLALSFSSLDSVGHAYGPESREVLDTLLRLDLVLGELLSFLDREVGENRTLVALSSDHGVLPLPELHAGLPEKSRRFTTGDILCHQAAGARLRERLGDGDWLLDDFYLNPAAIAARGLDLHKVARQLADIYEDCPAVRRAWTATDMEAGENHSDAFFQLYVNNYQPQRSPDVMLQMKPGILPYARPGTSHGSPYSYDTHVPVLLMVPGFGSGRIEEKIHTVDLAPTIAALVGLNIPAGLDGRSQVDMMQSLMDLSTRTEAAESRSSPTR